MNLFQAGIEAAKTSDNVSASSDEFVHKMPTITIHKAAKSGDIEALKAHLERRPNSKR